MRYLLRILLPILIISACAPHKNLTQGRSQDFASQLNFSPDDRLLAVTTNTGLYLYDTDTLRQLKEFRGLQGASAVLSKKYLAAFGGNHLSVWKLSDDSRLFQEKETDPIHFQSAAISPDDNWLATGEQQQFRLWSLPDGNVAAKIPINGFVSNLAFTNHNTLIVIEQYKAVVQEWDLQTQEMIRSFEVPRDVLFFNLSRDGKVMFVDYGESGVELWDVEAGKPIHYYQQMQGASGWTRLSGNYNAAIVWGYALDGQQSGMGVWDLPEDKRLYEFPTPFVRGDGWRSGALNSDGSLLAASNNQGYIYFYDLRSGKKTGEIFLPYTFIDY